MKKTAIALILLIVCSIARGETTEISLFTASALNGAKDSVQYGQFTLPEGYHTIRLSGSTQKGDVNVNFAYNSAPDPNGKPSQHFSQEGSDVFTGLTPGNYQLSVKGVTAYSGFNLQIDGIQSSKVILFLHGLAGSPDSWDAFVSAMSSGSNTVVAPIIFKGNGEGIGVPVTGQFTNSPETGPESQDYYLYRIRFGAYDVSGHLQTITHQRPTGPSSGDFETFATLGREVKEAVDWILKTHPGAEICLVAHSRGGVAGRAFLQGTYPLDRSAIVGFLTLGTPHNGSYFGRIVPYLAQTPRKADPKTWNVATLVSSATNGVDCFAPSVGFLATGSAQIKSLKLSVPRLPSNISYCNYVYTGRPLGLFPDPFGSGSIDIFPSEDGTTVFHVSKKARIYMIGNQDPAVISGDGIVQADSQTFKTFARLPVSISANLDVVTLTNGIFHTDEPDRTEDILDGLESMLGWNLQP